MATGYKFPILDSSGAATTTVVDLDDMFVRKDAFLRSSLHAWGSNSVGQVGNGTTVSYYSPVQIGLLTNWKQVSFSKSTLTGYSLKNNGTLWGWGINDQGQLGNNSTTNYSSPIQIGALTSWKHISACILL